MEELDIAAVTKRSIRGVFALVTRSFVINIISFAIGSILLPLFLTPAEFGVFFVVTAVIAFLQYFSDIGLAAALIQKKEAITQEDLATTFTIQQVLVVLASSIALSLSGVVANFYHLDSAGVFLYQALVISFFLSSLKTIPSILLERNLRFEKLVIPQIVETLFYNVVALIFAMKGFGIASFTYAILARGLSGLIVMYIIAPWRVQIGFSTTVAKRLLKFGIPFQANSFLALLKDDLVLAYLGRVLPLAQVGYVGFAQRWAFAPLRLIMDNVIRITFPSFSRLQHEKKHLSLAIEKSLFVLGFLIFPSLTGLVVLAPYLLTVFPRYSKWEPALAALTFFAINAALSSISTPLTNALSAIGKITITMYFMIFWTIITWVLTPLFVVLYGYNGVAYASALIGLSVVGVVFITKKYVDFSLKELITPIVSSSIMGIILFFLGPFFIKTEVSIVLAIVLGMIIYFTCMYVLAKKQVIADMRIVINNLKRNS